MNYELTLTVDTKNADKLLQIAALEVGKKDRAEIKIHKGRQKVIFSIFAGDATALKASVSIILKIISILEKTIVLVRENG